MYPKSTRDDARFPFIGSRAIPRSILYTTGFTSFRQLQRFPETPVSSLEEHQFQQSHSMKAPCTTYHLEMRADSLASTEEQANFPQAPQEDASFSNRYVRGILSLLPQVEWTLRCPDSKEDWISVQWLECRLVFHLPRGRGVCIPCGDPRESPRSPRHLDRRPHIPLTSREASGVQCFKR